MMDWIEGSIVGKKSWTPRLFSLQFEAAVLPFKAGQFLRLGLDVAGTRVGRPYSLVNAPQQAPLEIYFHVVPDGLLSPRLAGLGVGDTLWVYRQPHGFLTLDEVPESPDLWLLATGTGVGPFLSLLQTPEIWARFEHIVLVQAVRMADELSYAEVIAQALSQHPQQFHFVPFVSREQIAGTIQGRIPAAIQDGKLEARAGVSLSTARSHVMLCGNSAMINDTIAVLAGRGLRRHRRQLPGHISTEKYF